MAVLIIAVMIIPFNGKPRSGFRSKSPNVISLIYKHIPLRVNAFNSN